MRTFYSILLLGSLLVGGLAACSTQSVDPNGDSSATFQANVTDIKNYAASKGLSGTLATSGLYYAVTKANSTAKLAALGEELEFSYKLYVLTGTSTDASSTTVVTDKLVDTTYATQSTFLPFFSGVVKPGLEQGLLLMREGEQATMLMPSTLAFGSVASSDGLIPANSPVRFDVTLKRSRSEDQQINEYIAANKLTVTGTTSTGLRLIKTQANAGDSLTVGKIVRLNYTLRLLRSTSPLQTSSLDVTVGTNGTLTVSGQQGATVTGFSAGVLQLRTGEKATLIFPSSIGYGTTGVINQTTKYYDIPPNSPLIYDVEVVSAR